MRRILITIFFIMSFLNAADQNSINNDYSISYLKKKNISSSIGLSLFSSGIVLDYGVVLPLSISGGDESRYSGLVTLNVSALGLKTTGSLMAGIAATRSEREYIRKFGSIHEEDQFDWKLYGSGWGFAVLGVIIQGNASNFTEARNIVGLTSLVASEVLFTIHTIKAKTVTSKYYKDAKTKSPEFSLGITPTLSKKNAGITVSLHF